MIDLFAPGAYCRTAGGNLERPQDQAPVVRWMAWSINPDNGMNGDPAAWGRCRQLWANARIEHFPWLHCRNLQDVERLITVGKQFGSPAIGLNIEDVVNDGLNLAAVRDLLLDFWGKPVHMATLPWVQNGQGWRELDFCVAALKFFPDEQGIWPGRVYSTVIARQCIQHAFDEGLKPVSVMFKTKGYQPSNFGVDFSFCHSLYTADDITPSAEGWNMWKSATPCVKPQPPAPAMLSEKKFPYTGPFYGPSHPKGPKKNLPSIKGLKRGLIRGGFLNQQLGSETDDFGLDMERAFKMLQRETGIEPVSGQYGRGTWLKMRALRVPPGRPNSGQYAMDSKALAYIREDAIAMCHPIPLAAHFTICQDLHATLGLTGNWAIDFCAAAGTAVRAVERAKITKLSGRDPALGVKPGGIFGWSIHYETPDGYRYFSTHYGTRAVQVGQIVDVGDPIGTIGNWPGNAHLHLGVTSPLGTADAKKRITAVKNAVRL